MARAKTSKGMPKALAAAIRKQHPDEAWRMDGGKPPRAPRIRVNLPPDPYCSPQPGLPLLRRPLVVEFPGLRLMSWNDLLSGKHCKRRQGESSAEFHRRRYERSRRANQARQKREAQAAVAALPNEGLYAVVPPVRIAIVQFTPDARREPDTDNLCGKALLDALVGRGVLPDDHCGIVPIVTHALIPCDATYVRVVVQPVACIEQVLLP